MTEPLTDREKDYEDRIKSLLDALERANNKTEWYRKCDALTLKKTSDLQKKLSKIQDILLEGEE